MEKKLFECLYCHEWFPDLHSWYEDDDSGWCSEDCEGAAEARGIHQWESQQEDEGND